MPRTKLAEKNVREKREATPKRVPVGGFRDKLTVQFKDDKHTDNFYHRWVLDTTEAGSRIIQFLQAGYEFVPSEDVVVGEAHITVTENVGSIVRRPAGSDGKYLYLMRLPMEYHQQDLIAKEQQIDATEEALHDPESLANDRHGVYGGIKIQQNKQE